MINLLDVGNRADLEHKILISEIYVIEILRLRFPSPSNASLNRDTGVFVFRFLPEGYSVHTT